ncbi:MAG: hypothetical protein WD738_00750, partial [Pirellulales bacterium]
VLTHNVMILVIVQVFYRATPVPFRFSRGTVDIGAYEAGRSVICVTTTNDEFNGLTTGGVSLREAVDYANTNWEAITICLPTGVYSLTISGSGGISQGDLDVTGNVTIVGDGPGLSVIDAGGIATDERIFDVANVLDLSGVTLTLGDARSVSLERNGGAIRVKNGGHLDLSYSTIAANDTGRRGFGGGIYFDATATGMIEACVITVNTADNEGGGVYIESGTGAITLKSTIIANNSDSESSTPDIIVGAGRPFVTAGYNRFTSYSGFMLHETDYLATGPVHYVVTSIADTYDGSNDPVNMSLRDAIDQANNAPGAQEIWLPAWEFRLTRDGTDAGAPNVSIGDLDVTEDLTIRGIDLATKVDASGIVDAAFDQIGGALLTLLNVAVIN